MKPFTTTAIEQTVECTPDCETVYYIHREGKFDANGCGSWIATCSNGGEATRVAAALNAYEAVEDEVGPVKPRKMSKLDQFAKEHHLVLETRERDWCTVNSPSRFHASFANTEVKEGKCLAGVYGDGRTQARARKAYAEAISGKLLVVNATGLNRREILVPNLT